MSCSPLLGSAGYDMVHEFGNLFVTHPLNGWLNFRSFEMEAAYRHWHQRVYKWDIVMGLLLSNFLFFLVAVVYSCWSHEYSTPDHTTARLLLLCDSLMGISLTMCFGFSLLRCTARRPYLFSAAALLLTSSFVVIRAYLLTNFAAVSPVVLIILIVCILLGSTLMRMPFVATLTAGVALLCIYGLLALLELQQAPDGSAWYPAALFFVIASASTGSRQLELAQRRLFLLQLRVRHLLNEEYGRGTSSTRTPITSPRRIPECGLRSDLHAREPSGSTQPGLASPEPACACVPRAGPSSTGRGSFVRESDLLSTLLSVAASPRASNSLTGDLSAVAAAGI